jgi:protein SCO1/2
MAMAAVLLVACGAPGPSTPDVPALQGTSMDNKPAPAFTLSDQNGKPLSLASLHGHPVVLTFLDATCTEQCPIMIQYLNWTTQFMTPQQVAAVKWVAISVNPNNTPTQATAFLTKNKPVMPIAFLLGSQAQLSPLWKAYYIEVEPGQTDVAHTSGLYVLDQQGRERIWLDGSFDPKDLSGDLQSLLAAG